MSTITPNQIRITTLILLIALLSLTVAGQRQLLDSLRNLAAGSSTPRTLSQPLATEAGAPALLLLNADALVLPLGEGSSPVTVRLRDAEGKAVAGVGVQFSSTLGSVNPASATTDAAGMATATFTVGATPGQAVVSAVANGLTRDAAIQIVKPNSDATANTIALDFPSTKLDPGQQSAVNVVVRDGSGQPLAGELISLFGSMGEVSPVSAVSDANGRASFTYHAGANTGQAMVTALAGYASKSVTFAVGTVTAPQQKQFLPLVTR